MGMAYKVILVDDEPIIRYGIASCIPWAEEGFELAGQAANGKEALKLLQRERVDIIISDIMMPAMDGLELAREAKKINPRVKVVMVSSYSEFKYAQEAVKTGVVVDYLLKPTMDPEDLLAVLHTCKDQLDLEEASQERDAFYAEEKERQLVEEAESRLRRCLLAGEPPPQPIRPWMREPLALSIWSWTPGAAFAEELRSRLKRLGTEMLVAVTGEQELALLQPDDNGSALSRLGRFHRELIGETAAALSVGASPAFHELKSLRSAYGWAGHALAEAFFRGEGRIYRGSIVPRRAEGQLSRDSWSEIQEACAKALDEAEMNSFATSCLERVFERWEQPSAHKKDVIGEAQSLLILFHAKLKKLHPDYTTRRAWDQLREIEATPSLEALVSWFRSLADQYRAEEPIPVMAEDSCNMHSIQLAMAYIRQHYLRDLSLQDAAEYVHMSKNYFSEQFKRHTGMNFIDYIIHLRIQHAKRLLRTTSMRVYEVGMQSGFNSSKHFLKSFKRKVACTPAEYRLRHAATAEALP